MKSWKQWKWVVGAALIATYAYAQSFDIQYPQGIRYVQSVNTAAEVLTNFGPGQFPGQFVVSINNSQDTAAWMWNQNDGVWEHIAGDALTLDGPITITGATTFNGSMTLGSDEIDTITVNAPIDWQTVYRDDFCNVSVIQSDGTVESGTDAELNHIYTRANGGGFYEQRIEIAATLGLAEQADADNCGLDVSGDVTANDGHEITFAPNTLMGIHRVDSATDEFYFEISITIGDISAFDGDWAVGVKAPEAYQNPPQHDGLNTYALWTLSDNAGDLDLECDVDGGGAANDDTGTTWADAATHVLRLEIDGDGYAAYIDGTAVTSTNCNSSNDFTDGDMLVPFYYHTQGAEGAASGVVLNYVEWGVGAI